MNLKLKLALTIIFSLALNSCMIPEKFTSSIDIQSPDTYKISYSGTMIMGMFQAEIMGKELSSSDKEELAGFSAELLKDDEIKTAEYVNEARYKINAVSEGELTKKIKFFGDAGFVTISPLPNNQVEIKGVTLTKEDIKSLKEIKINIDGKITLKTKGKVVKHNAVSTPIFGFGTYKWDLKSYEDAPLYALIQF